MTDALSLFLSHDWGENGKNHQKVVILQQYLEKLIGIENGKVWIDQKELLPGKWLPLELSKNITNCNLFLMFITENYQNKFNRGDSNDACWFELTTAIQLRKPIIPILLSSSMKVRDETHWIAPFSTYFRDQFYIDFSDESIFENNQRLIDYCQTILSYARKLLEAGRSEVYFADFSTISFHDQDEIRKLRNLHVETIMDTWNHIRHIEAIQNIIHLRMKQLSPAEDTASYVVKKEIGEQLQSLHQRGETQIALYEELSDKLRNTMDNIQILVEHRTTFLEQQLINLQKRKENLYHAKEDLQKLYDAYPQLQDEYITETIKHQKELQKGEYCCYINEAIQRSVVINSSLKFPIPLNHTVKNNPLNYQEYLKLLKDLLVSRVDFKTIFDLGYSVEEIYSMIPKLKDFFTKPKWLESENHHLQKYFLVKAMQLSESLILDHFWIFHLLSIISNDIKESPSITLLYRSSIDGMKGENFHRCCDKQSKVLILIKDMQGNIFGGFISSVFDSPQLGYNHLCIEDSNAYIFTLKNPYQIPPTKYFLKPNASQNAIRSYTNQFSFGHDLGIDENGSYWCCFPLSYEDTTRKQHLTFTGINTIPPSSPQLTLEIEAWKIN